MRYEMVAFDMWCLECILEHVLVGCMSEKEVIAVRLKDGGHIPMSFYDLLDQ